ncbi:hypothetical protein ACJX0J_040745, partial [Zea mays]
MCYDGIDDFFQICPEATGVDDRLHELPGDTLHRKKMTSFTWLDAGANDQASLVSYFSQEKLWFSSMWDLCSVASSFEIWLVQICLLKILHTTNKFLYYFIFLLHEKLDAQHVYSLLNI